MDGARAYAPQPHARALRPIGAGLPHVRDPARRSCRSSGGASRRAQLQPSKAAPEQRSTPCCARVLAEARNSGGVARQLWTKNLGRLGPELARLVRRFRPHRFGSMSTKVGPNSTNIEPCSAKLERTWKMSHQSSGPNSGATPGRVRPALAALDRSWADAADLVHRRTDVNRSLAWPDRGRTDDCATGTAVRSGWDLVCPCSCDFPTRAAPHNLGPAVRSPPQRAKSTGMFSSLLSFGRVGLWLPL